MPFSANRHRMDHRGCWRNSFDWDQGYRGQNNSNWLVIQDQPNGIGDRGGELDGDDSDDGNVSADEMPFSTPTVTGWTIVGVGGKQGLLFRNGSGGHVSNALLANVAEGIEIEDKETPEDAFDRFIAGDLTLSTSRWWGRTAPSTTTALKSPTEMLSSTPTQT